MSTTSASALSTFTGQDGVTAMIISVFRAVGMELTIFCITVVFAFVIRRGKLAAARSASSRRPRKEKEGALNSERSAPGSPKPQGAEQSDLQRLVATYAGDAKAPAGKRREGLWCLINEIVECARTQPGPRSANRALDMYGELRRALREDSSLRIAKIAERSYHIAIDFYTVLVQCALRAGQGHLVETIIDDMAAQGIARPLTFYESAMKQLAGQKHYQLALDLYDRLDADGLEPSPITLSCLINFASELGQEGRAVTFFDKLCSLASPSIRACMTMLRMHSKRHDWASSLATLKVMRLKGVAIDNLALNVVLAIGIAAEQFAAVEELLRETEASGVADVVSYNTVIKGYSQRSDMDGAVRMLARLRARGLRPNAITYNTVMDAAIRSARCVEAWDFLAEMHDDGIVADKFSCSILLKGLAKEAAMTPAAQLHLGQQGKLAEHVRTSLQMLTRIGSSMKAELATSLYHIVLDAAVQVRDPALVLQASTQMRQWNVVPSDDILRRMCELMRRNGPSSQ